MKEIRIMVGLTTKEKNAMVLDAVRRFEAGEITEDQPTILNFESWEHMTRTLTSGRLELLRHLHRHPTASIYALAQALGRKYPNVHADVQALTEAGLIERDETGLHFDYDEVSFKLAV